MKKVVDVQPGFISNEVYKPEQFGNSVKLIDSNGNKVGTMGVSIGTRKQAIKEGSAIQAFMNKNGKKTYRRVDMSVYDSLVVPMNSSDGGIQVEVPSDHEAVTSFIHNDSIKLKPRELVMSELKWKYLIRSAVRAKNIMMTGPAGCGKCHEASTKLHIQVSDEIYEKIIENRIKK